MYILKSVIVILFLVVISMFFGFLLFRYIQASKKRLSNTFITTLVGIITLLAYANLWPYTNPVDQTLDLKLVSTLEIPPECTLSGPQNLPWHAVYERYGIFYPESLYFINIEDESHLGLDWPDMDLDHYTYIISYGQKVESLSYNVWETIESPFYNGAKVGHAVLSNHFESNEVYIYQIKKIRIDNDT